MSGPTGMDQTPPFGPRSAVAPQADIDPSLAVIERLVIAGVPKAGKTTTSKLLAELSKAKLRHCDTLIESHSWSEASAEVATWFDEPGPWIVEGVATVRALRKWMRGDPKTGLQGHDGKPCDAVLWMPVPLEVIEGRVLGLARGCGTVWQGIVAELVDRGVQIITPK